MNFCRRSMQQPLLWFLHPFQDLNSSTTLWNAGFVTSCHRRFFCTSKPLRFSPDKVIEPRRDESSSLVLYDSLTSSYKALPSTEKGLAWYTCGPTTYAPAHLGHARTYVCLDILRRIVENHAFAKKHIPPLFVMNVTDVDDKILATASTTGESPLDLARRYEKEFWKDFDALGCLRPHIVTRVSDHVESDVIPYIDKLVKHDMAYVTDDGVYFDVRAFEDKMGCVTKYGKLAPPSASSDFFSASGSHESDVEGKKRDIRDFVLWKQRKPDESLYWLSPWGEGRPGWHIECSAMIESVQRQFRHTHNFLVHAGGADLKFPHHTNEIAQAEAYHFNNKTPFKEWIPHWVHTGHLHIHGMKMSKSLKNFITIEEMLSDESSDGKSVLSCPADDFRLWCLGLSGSYRGPATYSKDRLDEARVLRDKIVRFLLDAESWSKASDESIPRRWSDDDHAFFELVSDASVNCRQAVDGWVPLEDWNGKTGGLEMEGSTYVKELLRIVEGGNAHLRHCRNAGNAPVEPVRAAVDTLRDLLSLVGFSDATIRIGLSVSQSEARQSHLVGGEYALINEFAQFRSAVRTAALRDIRNDDASDNMNDILKLCDHVRKDVLPTMGLELLDEKDPGHNSTNAAHWRFCVPRLVSTSSKQAAKEPDKTHMQINYIPVKDLFRVGQYKDMFSEFDDNGFPTRKADGAELSKRLRKKLLKKLEKHRKRQAPQQTEAS